MAMYLNMIQEEEEEEEEQQNMTGELNGCVAKFLQEIFLGFVITNNVHPYTVRLS